MKLALLIALLPAVTSKHIIDPEMLLPHNFPDSDETEWHNFKIKFSRHYASFQEEHMRKAVFMTNIRQIREHNAAFLRGETSFSEGVNNFTDWTEEDIEHWTGPHPNYYNQPIHVQ